MKISIKKFNSRTWEWSITDEHGNHLRGGHSRTKASAENDSSIVRTGIEADRARADGRIAMGEIVRIKPEWQDPGDENYTFIAYDTQLPGMTSIRVQATRKSDGQLSIGLQSVGLEMIDR